MLCQQPLVKLASLSNFGKGKCFIVNCALLMDCDDLEGVDANKESTITYLCEWMRSPIIITTTDRRRSRLRPALVFDIERPTIPEQLWK